MGTSNRRKTGWRLRFFLGAAAALILAGWVVEKETVFGQAPALLQDELRAAKASGLPMSTEDLRRRASAPDGQNAAPFLRTAFADLDAFESSADGKVFAKLSKQPHGLSTTTEPLDALAPFVGKQTSLFEALHRAAQMPRLDFQRPWQNWTNMSFPEFGKEKNCVRLLILKARIDLKAGRTQDALNTLDDASRISALVAQEPVVLAWLMQSSISSQICATLEQVTKASANDAGVLAKCRQTLLDLGPRPDMMPAIQSEFLTGRFVLRQLTGPNGEKLISSDRDSEVATLSKIGPILTAYDLRYTQLYRRMNERLTAAHQSYPAMTRVYLDTEKQIAAKSSSDLTYGFVKEFYPIFTQAIGAVAEGEAMRNVLLSAIALLDQKRLTGQFPSKLPSETGHWIDPCSDKPLVYHPTKTGFLIYSVGRSGKDLGGSLRPKKYNGGLYNIPFSFP